MVLNFFEYDAEEKIMFSIFYIANIPFRLKLSDSEKWEWISTFNNLYKREFNADKNLNIQLDLKFKHIYLNFVKSDEYAEKRNLIYLNSKESGRLIENIFSIPILSDFFQNIFTCILTEYLFLGINCLR